MMRLSLVYSTGYMQSTISRTKYALRTFHDVDERAHVALLDDETVAGVLYRVHAVHDFPD